MLDCLRRELLLCLRKEPERRALAEDLFQDIRLVIGKTAERVLGASRLDLEHWSHQLSLVGARLIGSFDLNDLQTAVIENFQRLGISSCYVVTYDGNTIPAKYSRLTLVYDLGASRQVSTPIQFATESLLPAEATNQSFELRNSIVAPLFFKEEVFGYMVIDFDVAHSFAYEAVRELISAALKGAMLVQDVRRQHEELNSALGIISDTEARHAECIEKVQRVLSAISGGQLDDPQEILRRVTGIISGP